MTQLSPNFTLEEAITSPTALRNGIENIPSVEQLAHMRTSAAGMEQVRAILGKPIHVNSWLRVEALEKILTAKDFQRWCAQHGHNPDSDWPLYFVRKGHPKGYAVDFICPEFGTPAEVAKKIAASALKFDQLIMEGTWVHVSFDPQMRQQVMMATFKDGVPTYSNAEQPQ